MLRIQRNANGDVVFTVSGRLAADNVSELSDLLAAEPAGRTVVIDLENVVLVDRDIVGFLRMCEGLKTNITGRGRHCFRVSVHRWPVIANLSRRDGLSSLSTIGVMHTRTHFRACLIFRYSVAAPMPSFSAALARLPPEARSAAAM